jgi:hypothetical protein
MNHAVQYRADPSKQSAVCVCLCVCLRIRHAVRRSQSNGLARRDFLRGGN